MSTIGNILWLIFGGFVTGLAYIVAGLAISLTIIGIPFGLQAIKLGIAMFCPFGKKIVSHPEADSPLRVIFNLIWLVVVGWEIALVHLAHAIVLVPTIIGIPLAVQHIKLIPLCLFPFGRDLR